MREDASEVRARFMKMLEEAEAEGVRDGFFTIEAVVEELDAIIDEAKAALSQKPEH